MMRISSRLVISILATTCWVLPGVAQQGGTFHSGEYTLYYETFGNGPPLYVLTGGPGEAPGYPYYRIIDSLKSAYTCVLLHQRGTGRSRAVPVTRQTISIANYVADVEALRKHRGDEKVILLGYSWGGLLAMSYAAKHPHHAANLVLLASAPPSYTTWNALYGNQYVRRSPAELDSIKMLQQVFGNRTERELDSMKRFQPNAPEVRAYKAFIRIHVRAMHYRRDNIYEHFDEHFESFNFQPIPFIDEEVLSTKMDITPQLRQLNIPALILYGRQDDQGEAVFYQQRDALRRSEIQVIEECGHEMVDDQPEQFFRVLMTYLKLR